jgi:dipeptidyl aminopeptidase/acylaminoacyl peptidase
VGAYGCSYGGYLSYMAAFLAPDVFKAVASASGWSDFTATFNSNPGTFLDTPVPIQTPLPPRRPPRMRTSWPRSC